MSLKQDITKLPVSVALEQDRQELIEEVWAALECTHWEKKGKKVRECMYLATSRKDLLKHIQSGKHVFHH